MSEKDQAETRVARHRRIEERYLCGDPIVEIASQEGVDRKTVRNVARRANLPHRVPRQAERNRRILRRYRAGDPVVDIARDERVTSPYNSRLARKSGLPARTAWRRRYPINESAFENPTEIGWWLIGLLAADGSVREQDHRISLSQREEDSDVLHAFLDYVGSGDRPLVEMRWASRPEWSGTTRYFEARIFSERIARVLAVHGIVPRKSRTLRFSDEAASQPAVWLGLFDGDGSAGLTRNHGRPRIDFYGTPMVMEQCATFWGAQLSFQNAGSPSIIRHAGGLSKVALYGANAARGAELMLASSPVSLKRKRRVLEAIAAVDTIENLTEAC